MRAICAASAAALGAAALALAAPAATAADGKASPLFTVSPSTVTPGGRVFLSASGCETTATASSGVFEAVTIQPGTSSVVTVAAGARPGTQHSVQFTCGSRRGSFNLTIAGGSSTPTVSSTVSAVPASTVRATPGSSAPATPRGVRGGLGGSVGEMDTWDIVIGAALVLAASGGAVLAVRRRPADDHRH
ncbi:lipoprotein [Streptomyces inusitatus]|uniref:Lipoprotein n=1 Tax=Streptomyces inusitatus TaxID=68221 RepID=A0A918QA85_9ACTN|nr:hypothetical protein [Streptomyces inusitatus]GGZ37388.1 lipoprotein [Streptomyces inusitatus]